MYRYAIISVLLILTGCVVTPEEKAFDALLTAPHVYTLTNLHPDERRSAVYTMNYQMDGLIPVCTEVKILQRIYGYMQFKTVESGRIYNYLEHGNPGEEFISNISKYFGTECKKAEIEQLSEIDRKGILRGKALDGMTRKAVIYALGYPPVIKTPYLDTQRWWYWFNRFNRFYVEFDHNGIVTRIKN
jgi:hypothetical protein